MDRIGLTASEDLFGNPNDVLFFFATWLILKWGPHNMDMFVAIYVSDARFDLGTARHRLYVYDI